VFENRVLRRIFEPKRDEVMGEWRKLQNGELHNLYSSPNIIRHIKSKRMRWAGHVVRMGEGRKVYRVLVGKSKGKRLYERPRRRWRDGIRRAVREIGWWGRVRSGFVWLSGDWWQAVMNAVMNLWVLVPESLLVTVSNTWVRYRHVQSIF
jgi:hypothetical protein